MPPSVGGLCRSCAALFIVGVVAGSAPRVASAQKVPEGFKAELVYQTPEIEHPSVVTCDDRGNLFVGEDPMDMRGPTTKEFDRVVYIVWDAEGHAKRKTVFCEGLSAVFGLVWRDDALYVMHAPHYTMFKDTNGDGVADVRRDLAEGFGPPAGVFGFNDHIVTGTRLGLDGLVYVSVGDKGIPKATGSDGSTITLEGGGVVRMRLDGSQLEVVTHGTRNHLDVAMDSLDNIFTYDNTDDGLGWWTRFTHQVPTGYYGYPYDYHPHPERHLPRISEHGGGSPVGGACYTEAAWPETYHNSPFFCEWGKGKVQRFKLKPKGASFEAEIEDFMTSDGSAEFRPLDLCFSPDGRHMYLADWNFAGWVQPKAAGRLFRVTYTGKTPAEPPRAQDQDPVARQVESLSHPSHAERIRAQHALGKLGQPAVAPVAAVLRDKSTPLAKVHAIWTEHELMTEVPGYDATADWIAALRDSDADVRGQAARALGLRRTKGAVHPLENALRDPAAGVRMRAAEALGRIGEPESAGALFAALGESDVYARFTMIQAIRAIKNWPPAAQALESGDEAVRGAVLLALTGQYDQAAVAVLVEEAGNRKNPALAAKAVEALAEVDRKADPYTGGWWGTQPARGKPARSKKNDWPGTSAVLTALDRALIFPAPEVQIAAIRGVRQVGDFSSAKELRNLAEGKGPVDVRVEAIAALAALKDEPSVPELAALAGTVDVPEAVRQEAVRALTTMASPAAARQLISIVASKQSTPQLVALALQALGTLKNQAASPAIEQRLTSKDPTLRAKAAEALLQIGGKSAAGRVVPLLDDADVTVRQTALRVLGDVGARDAIPAMVAAAAKNDVRPQALVALAAMPDRRALPIYLDGLVDPNPTQRDAARKALVTVRSQVAPDVLAMHAAHELPTPVQRELQTVFSTPAPISAWVGAGAWDKAAPMPKFDFTRGPDVSLPLKVGDRELKWKTFTTKHPQGMVNASEHFTPQTSVWAVVYAEVKAELAGERELVVGSDDQVVLYVNAQKIYESLGDRGWAADQARVRAKFNAGVNHIWMLVGNTGGGWQFSLQMSEHDPRFAFLYENVPAKLDTIAYRDFALKIHGEAAHGQKLFADTRGVGCIKCHAVGGQGGKVGPDLVGIGAKYPREELVRSVLEPSNRVAESFQVTTVVTTGGQVLQGLVKSDTEQTLELIDVEGKVHPIAKAEIDQRERSPLSLMPNGLKDGLTLQDFADIVAYLESLKQPVVK